MTDLNDAYALSEAQVAAYRRDGYIKLANVFDEATLTAYGTEITRLVLALSTQHRPIAERSTYQKAFLQVMNLWRESDMAHRFVMGRRLAGIAAGLMGTASVRLYHDQALYKEPGGGLTPWHADQYYWPLASDAVCTAWIPLQPTPLELGPLAFSVGSQAIRAGRDLEIGDDSEAFLSRALLEQGLPIDETPFAIGEVSFHSGWTFHRAGANRSDRPRSVMTMIYMDGDMRIAEPTSRAQTRDLERWCPGIRAGEVAASALNPVLYSRDNAHG